MFGSLCVAFLMVHLASPAPIDGSAAHSQPGHFDLLPMPAHLTARPGALALGQHFQVTLHNPHPDSRIETAVQRFLARVQHEHGSQGVLGAQGLPEILIKWSGEAPFSQRVSDDESYELHISTQRATLTARTPVGVLRGLQTLAQWVQGRGDSSCLPSVDIEDKPRFVWRGLLLDVARHFQPMEILRRQLDAMESFKLNVLHLHLTDDQGFRIESKRYPELQNQGAGGQFYSQQQARELVDYARDRGVRIVPEFDMPAHVQSWLVSHPELGSRNQTYKLGTAWGIYDAAFDPSRETTYDFIANFLGEMTNIFPDAYVHLGGDEVTGKHWASNAQINGFMAKNNIQTVHGLQTYFANRVVRSAELLGKHVIGWDEVLQPGLDREAVIQSWRGAESVAMAADAGYSVILSHGWYLDSGDDAAEFYSVNPQNGVAPANAHLVLGGEACQWGELVDQNTVEASIWPRTIAIAERLWSPAEVNDTAEMYRRLLQQSNYLADIGLTHRSAQRDILLQLTHNQAIGPLETLAAALRPQRHNGWPQYSATVPLNTFCDALNPESALARSLLLAVNEAIDRAPSPVSSPALVAALQEQASNYEQVLQLVEGNMQLMDAYPMALQVRGVARIGLQALQSLQTERPPAVAWVKDALALLDYASEAHSGMVVAFTPAIRCLVRAAAEADEMGPGWAEAHRCQ